MELVLFLAIALLLDVLALSFGSDSRELERSIRYKLD
jgi:hypothetical protein